eukprot:8679510-Pyramimonas_sp.AAC.1
MHSTENTPNELEGFILKAVPEDARISSSSSYTIPLAIPSEQGMYFGHPMGISTPRSHSAIRTKRYLSTRDRRKKNEFRP